MLPRTPVASADDRKPLGVRDVEFDTFRPTTVSHRAPSGDDLRPRYPSQRHRAGPNRADIERSNGRGLLLVEAFSRAWGSLPANDRGKVTWAVLDV